MSYNAIIAHRERFFGSQVIEIDLIENVHFIFDGHCTNVRNRMPSLQSPSDAVHVKMLYAFTIEKSQQIVLIIETMNS